MTNTETDSLPLPNELMPRANFKSAGTVLFADFAFKPPRFPSPGTTSRVQRLGKRYEAKVIKALQKLNGPRADSWHYGPWLYYTNSDGAARYCQPDILLCDSSEQRIWLFEIKLTHTIDAHFQLRKLYLPVVKAVFPNYRIHLVEITRSYDPATNFPGPILGPYFDLSTCIANMLTVDENTIGIFQWRL